MVGGVYLLATQHCLISANAKTAFHNAKPPKTSVNQPEIQAFILDLVKRDGFDQETLNKLFSQTTYLDSSVQLVTPPSSPALKNWQRYRARFIETNRINEGVRFWKNNTKVLSRAAAQFGIPEEIIVAIIGVETRYGQDKGRFRTIDTLFTLAFNYPQAPNRLQREALFRQEIEDFLLWCRERGIDPKSVYGSYAGAIGIPQFMPSSLRRYGVDYDNDQRVDLRESNHDAIASIANFLSQHGWKTGQPIAWKVAPDALSQAIAQKNADGQAEFKKTLNDLSKVGLKITLPITTKQVEGTTPIFIVDLPTPNQATEYWLGLQNFYVLTRYNRSFFYAMAVYELATAIKAQY